MIFPWLYTGQEMFGYQASYFIFQLVTLHFHNSHVLSLMYCNDGYFMYCLKTEHEILFKAYWEIGKSLYLTAEKGFSAFVVSLLQVCHQKKRIWPFFF